jgi:hypothetical protein
MQVIDYPAYEVLEDGRVIGARGRRLHPDLNSVGYERVTLCKYGKVKRVFVHRLVAQHFVENPDNHRYVNHKDGNRRNNSAENLEWCTASFNVQDGWDRGRVHFTKLGAEERATTIP